VSNAILLAIAMLGRMNMCLEANWYPDPLPGEIVSYVSIGRCVLPTTKEYTARTIIRAVRKVRLDEKKRQKML
jgi:hypothetical protein